MILRKLSSLIRFFSSFLRAIWIKSNYPNTFINKGTFLSKNVDIKATKTSKITIINSHIGKNVKIIADHGGEVTINNSFIGDYSIIVSRESIVIEDNCLISEFSIIRDQNHITEKNGLKKNNGFLVQPIRIEKNVWVGAMCCVLKGSIIKEGAVIGANSVVNSTIEPYSLYTGSPAVFIKQL